MKIKIEKEVGLIKHLNHDQNKQSKLQIRIEGELKNQNKKISNFRTQIHNRIKSEKSMHNSCKLIKGKESDINSTYEEKRKKVIKSVFDIEAKLKRDIKPSDYKKQ